MTEQKAARTGSRRNFGEQLVLFIWNVLIGALLIIFIVLYVPYYCIQRLIRRIRRSRQGLHRQ